MKYRAVTCIALLLFTGLATGALMPTPPTIQIEQEEYLEADDWFQAGVELNSEGNYREATEAFSRSVALAPSNALAWLNLGTTQALSGDYTRGIDSLKKSVQLDPSLALAYSNLGEVCFRADRYDEAVEAYTILLKLWPGNANALYKLGLSHLLLDETEKAQGDYLSLKIVDPELAEKLRHAIIQGAGN
ncbi:tetratricopeptide repeat protein [Geomonas sp. Red69]|uniref:Tetratricopeptide repeat protein n=1 Tax=Geomonas diazotrophica TaxID=2843197 RepID=A0ABX8JNA2_9BACT|nr:MULTISPECIES: tetratricopeptide repeat protein [Geomonas]MBU5636291.1 tetratricopeptide repeat protein [Geomonas diazotrophica]QWV99208.1 tetratricopeptide repeat protein [Geomonas nitrogeniifigens]QXE88377.1 tetratricopeptide repeat protein [Geomonas nitrogeniifigens]